MTIQDAGQPEFAPARPTRLNRRAFLCLALGAAGVQLLAACGGQTLATPAPGGGAASAPTAASGAGGAPTTAPAPTKGGSPVASPSGAGAAASPAGQQGGELKIGVLYPLTGSLAQAGNDSKAAVELAAEIVNNAYPNIALPLAKDAGLPRLGGAKVVPVFADHQGKAEVGQSEAERLIGDKVIALYGAYASAVTKTASAVAERSSIPFVNGESSSPALTEQGYKWFFRTSPTDDDFSKAMFDFITGLNQKKNAGIKSVALFYEDTDFGTNSAKSQKMFAQQAGITIAAEVKYRSNATSLTSEVQTLKASNADLLLPSSYQNDAILLLKQMKELDYNPKLIVAQDAGFLDTAFVTAMGKDAEGVTSRAAFASDITEKKPQVKAVAELFKQKANRDLVDISARAFTGFLTLCDAINRAGSTAPEAIRTALQQTDTPGDQTVMPWKGIKFDQKGQNTLGEAIIVQLTGGAFKTVFPFEFASTDVVFPVPAWGSRK